MSSLEIPLDAKIEEDLKNYFSKRSHLTMFYFAPKDIYPKAKRESQAKQVRNNRWNLTMNMLKSIDSDSLMLDDFKIDLYKKTTRSCIFLVRKIA